MAAPNRCWSDLPVELLCSIQKHLPLTDYLRFGAVCRWWRFAAELRVHRPAAGPPWLMLTDPRGDHDSVVRFVSFDDKIYSFPLPVEGFYSRLFLGSSNGWLITLDRSPKIHLLNPLTGAQFQLPPFGISRSDMLVCEMFWDGFHTGVQFAIQAVSFLFRKTILTVPAGGSTTTLDRGYTVATIRATGPADVSKCVAVTSDGSEEWSLLNPVQLPYCDIIFYNGFLCAVTDDASVMVWDLSAGPIPELVSSIPPPRGLTDLRGENKFYLVESSGDLLLVVVTAPAARTKNLIYKLDLGRRKWNKVRGLGEHMLFTGLRLESTCLSVRGFPQLMGNYFYLTTDGFCARPLDPGVTTIPHTMAYSSVCSILESYSPPPWFIMGDYSPPLWFTPSI